MSKSVERRGRLRERGYLTRQNNHLADCRTQRSMAPPRALELQERDAQEDHQHRLTAGLKRLRRENRDVPHLGARRPIKRPSVIATESTGIAIHAFVSLG